MKQFIIIALSCLLFACDKNEDGLGTDPELNIVEYTFSKEGGSIEVYSQIGHTLTLYLTEPKEGKTITYWSGDDGEIKSIDGGWYFVSIDPSSKKIHVETKPNDSNQIRTIPLSIMSGNSGCRPKYVQEK